ncbi:putative DNA-binding WGR domain protein [Pseudorhizobium tarimense]|uniref:DNA-binding WGR domain protein n=1 Tax=Pseudorhizobium tarimense TaxID=1079109 RepID=A0ABV2HBZ8_9HYPH|nr:WGR domain-containing protein [Pseudorhizobium tarimense]MCJ8521160.1 WGR domain-containing protein [Pseudorhizobium tarimense]
MSYHVYHVHIRRIDRRKNMSRFYALSIQHTLFGNVSLIREWGRTGTRGQQRIDVFEDEKQALSSFLALLRQKRKRGYVPCPSGVLACGRR